LRDGRLYGLGACDTKGGLAAFLTVALELADDPGWSGTLIVQGVADEEEGGLQGAGLLLERGLLTADAAVVAEPTSCLPAPRHLGVAWAQVLIRGAAAHAGQPSHGIDAVRNAYRYMAIVDSVLERSLRDPEFPGHPRLNVGAIQSGGHPGTVSGECRMLCDIRVLPGQEYAVVYAIFSDAARILEGEVPGVTVDVAPYAGGGRAAHDTPSDAAVTAAFRAAVAERGETRICKFTGGTDASFFDRAGTPAVVYGPGSLDQAHAPDEYVPLRELDIAVSDLRRVARILISR
jgi:acetylornithine deacetylase/succinyl-diaminopimelate desuccinylase-like protein